MTLEVVYGTLGTSLSWFKTLAVLFLEVGFLRFSRFGVVWAGVEGLGPENRLSHLPSKHVWTDMICITVYIACGIRRFGPV